MQIREEFNVVVWALARRYVSKILKNLTASNEAYTSNGNSGGWENKIEIPPDSTALIKESGTTIIAVAKDRRNQAIARIHALR